MRTLAETNNTCAGAIFIDEMVEPLEKIFEIISPLNDNDKKELIRLLCFNYDIEII